MCDVAPDSTNREYYSMADVEEGKLWLEMLAFDSPLLAFVLVKKFIKYSFFFLAYSKSKQNLPFTCLDDDYKCEGFQLW